MRSFLLFTLAAFGLAVLTTDASAIGRKKKRGRGDDCCGAPAPQTPCCGQVGYGPQPGHAYGAAYASPCDGPNVGLAGAAAHAGTTDPNVIQATDGTVYYRGADGSYYTTPTGMTGGTYPGMYRTRGGYPGVYQAGYPGTVYPGGNVYPAGGPPIQMPAVPQPMPRR